MTDSLLTNKTSWPFVAVGDVICNVTDTVDPLAAKLERFVGLDHLDKRDLRVRRWGQVINGTTFTRRFDAGNVLFGKRRVYQRKAAVPDFAGVCSGDLLVLSSSDGSLIPELIQFVVSTDGFVAHALATSAGSLSPRTKWNALAEFRFRLPPADIQARLVDLMGAALDHADTCLAAALATSLLASSKFDDGLSKARHARRVHVSDILMRSPESGCSAPESPRPTGHYVLGLQAISSNGYIPGQIKAVQPTTNMRKARVRQGDLLVARSNTLDRVGFAAICDEDRDDISFPDTMMRLCPDEDQVLPAFLAQVLMSPTGRRYIERIAAGTSASMKKINRRTLGAFEFALPTIDSQRMLLADHRQALQAVDVLRKAAHSATTLTNIIRREAFET